MDLAPTLIIFRIPMKQLVINERINFACLESTAVTSAVSAQSQGSLLTDVEVSPLSAV